LGENIWEHEKNTIHILKAKVAQMLLHCLEEVTSLLATYLLQHYSKIDSKKEKNSVEGYATSVTQWSLVRFRRGVASRKCMVAIRGSQDGAETFASREVPDSRQRQQWGLKNLWNGKKIIVVATVVAQGNKTMESYCKVGFMTA